MNSGETTILCPWSTEDQDTAVDDDAEDEREEARKVLRKKRFNMELICAIIDTDHTREEIIEEIKRCLNNGASPEARCQDGDVTACHVAATFGEDNFLRVLMEAGASPSSRDKFGRQPHHLAAARGHESSVTLLVSKDPKSLINSQVFPPSHVIDDSDYDSNMHNHVEVSSLLPNIIEGSTALHIASRFGFINIVDFLIENGAKLNIKDFQHQTPLDVAGIDADQSVPGTIVMAAIPAEDIPQDDISWVLPSNKEIKTKSRQSKKKKKEKSQMMKILKSIMNTGVMLSKGDLSDKKTTPLHTAVRKEDIQAIGELLERGVPMDSLDESELTPVHLAVELRLIESLNILLEQDSSAVNFKDGRGRTPLHVAVEHEWMKGAQNLLEHKTDLKITSRNGETILHVAARKGNPPLLKTLLQRFSSSLIQRRDNEGYTPLFRAVEKGDIECVNMLLENINSPTFKKYIKRGIDPRPSATLIHVAVKSNSISILNRLISVLQPTDTYLNFWNGKGLTALHLAVQRGHKECTEILLHTEGIRIDLRSEIEERTVLHFAAESGCTEIAQMIFDECAIVYYNLVNDLDKDGREPLILAVSNGHRECALLLLTKGANLASRDGTSGSSALDLIYYKIHQPLQMLDDLLDSFVTKDDSTCPREDDPDLEVKVDYTTLLADVRNNSRQFGVIDAINNCSHEKLQQKLFLHPLVESFLVIKWKQLKYFFKILVLIYFVHIFSLTGVATMTYAYHFPIMAWICRVIVLITLVPIIFWELLNASRFERFYLLDGETWVKWAVIFTTVLVTVIPEQNWARYLTSVSVLLAWIELLFLYSKTFTWGLIVQMFFEVAKNVVEVLTTFIFLILGFAFAFLVLFNERYPFENLWTTLCKVLVMMVELDYNGTFDDDEEEFDTFSVLGRLMYLGFIILVVMVMINLIQSMSVNDVAKLEAQGRSNRLAKKASFLSLLESFCYNNKMINWLPRFVQEKIKEKRSVPKRLYVRPNRPTGPDNPLPDKLRSSIVQVVFNRDIPHEADTLNNKMDHLVSDVEKIYDMIRDIKETLQRLEAYND